MPRRRRPYSASRSKRTSRQVVDSTLGTHVEREARNPRVSDGSRHVSSYARSIVRRARIRRIAAGVIAVVVVIGVSVGAGFFAFRGTVGGEFALKASDARDALVEARTGDPTYVLVVAELGSVAVPLDNGGPDVILLARLDEAEGSLALVDLPTSLQITIENRSESLADIAGSGDAALIEAVSAFSKVDIAHFAKVDEGGLVGIVDALGGIDVDVDQVVDDPRAGDVYLPAGMQELSGDAALAYLRATNLKYGPEDQLVHELVFAAGLLEKLFSADGSFTTRLESIGTFFQTDYSLSDLEAIHAWLGGVEAQDIVCTVAPGYFTVVTNVHGADGERFVSTSAEMAALIEELDSGNELSTGRIGEIDLVEPSSFTVDVQNGTTVEGAASAAAGMLRSKGFIIGDVGNAEQPVFGETLVVYRDDERGLSCAETVIDALGVGRAVASSSYYAFAHDVLLIIGADNKPVA